MMRSIAIFVAAYIVFASNLVSVTSTQITINYPDFTFVSDFSSLLPGRASKSPFKEKGLKVLIVAESGTYNTLPQDQLAILNSAPFRDFLDVNCHGEWKIYDPDAFEIDAGKSDVPQTWKDVMARPRTVLPWIAVGNGKSGFEGPLPATVAETEALILKYKTK